LLFDAAMRVVAVVVLFAGCMGRDPIEVSAEDPLPEGLHAGDVIYKDALALEVPEAGETVTITVDREDGQSFALSITHSPGGEISVVDATPDDEPLGIAAASARPCDDGAFHLAGHAWATAYEWSFQAGSTPAANRKDNVETGLLHAANAIETSRNDCGLADQVSATARYLGRTASAPNIKGTTTTVTCGTRDNDNVVGFGSLPSSFLGVACSWSDGAGSALEGDITLSAKHRWFALAVPKGCSGARYGIQAVATHELGHVFGLAHVSEAAHPSLTMSTAAASCTNAPLTLGLGDVRGLRQLY
jgi:hypothetical protein